MSRSYKRFPVYKRHEAGAKREANRRVRRTKDVIQHNGYKRLMASWIVYEYRFYCTKADMRQILADRARECELRGEEFDGDIKWWYKAYRWK